MLWHVWSRLARHEEGASAYLPRGEDERGKARPREGRVLSTVVFSLFCLLLFFQSSSLFICISFSCHRLTRFIDASASCGKTKLHFDDNRVRPTDKYRPRFTFSKWAGNAWATIAQFGSCQISSRKRNKKKKRHKKRKGKKENFMILLAEIANCRRLSHLCGPLRRRASQKRRPLCVILSVFYSSSLIFIYLYSFL